MQRPVRGAQRRLDVFGAERIEGEAAEALAVDRAGEVEAPALLLPFGPGRGRRAVAVEIGVERVAPLRRRARDVFGCARTCHGEERGLELRERAVRTSGMAGAGHDLHVARRHGAGGPGREGVVEIRQLVRDPNATMRIGPCATRARDEERRRRMRALRGPFQ